MEKRDITKHIKAEAIRLGFDVCGIAQASPVEKETIALYNSWIEKEHHGEMSYLERNCEKRHDPTKLVEGCKSIIAVAMNYAPETHINEISDYALGYDYHKIVKDKLFLLLQEINKITPCSGRAFCDSAPVLERYWAVKAGLGWIGRNHQLVIPGKGSYFFLGELIIDLELEYDTPFNTNHCGNCTKCIENCPTSALNKDGFDARKCLSYLTIEYRGELPADTGGKMGNCFYGCDRCQTACPHNRFAKPNKTQELQPSTALLNMTHDDWKELTMEQYQSLFANSAIKRCGYEQLMRNINALKRE